MKTVGHQVAAFALFFLILAQVCQAFQHNLYGHHNRASSKLYSRKPNTVSPQEVYKRIIEDHSKFTYLDVRPPSQFARGHPPNAINVPVYIENMPPRAGRSPNYAFVDQVEDKLGDVDGKIIFLADHDMFSVKVAHDKLKEAGFQNMYIMEGGHTAWAQDFSLPIEYEDEMFE
mmetsp:Transcript_35184/g.45167  ORF Transcript_35184/g.45167 Transcript_35184/m.45167 type:complete len:173 (+) Transcript_35184:111-629(+)